MAKTNNSLNLLQVEGSINIKQADSGSLMSYKLLDENADTISELEGQSATVRLIDGMSNTVRYLTTAKVTDNVVEFTINKVLEARTYLVEILVGGYVFPSDRKTKIKVIPSAGMEVDDSPVIDNTGKQDDGLDPLVAYNLAKI